MDRKRPEILAPAGSLEVLKTAVRYGADAVYIGGEMYGLRAKARNFSAEDMRAGIEFAHRHGRKVYVTANITAHDSDLDGVERYFRELKDMGPDALIISDPGVFLAARRLCPEIDVHISTQANNVNSMTFRFWHEQGASRVVTARELSIGEIAHIREHIPEELEIETFVHGAMCISYSGRCLLSNYFTGMDANRGACTHPCRWKYHLVEETRPGEYLPVEENERGTYIFNSKDLCMIGHIPELVGAGIDSFKIEGRMKTALYVAVTVRAYRRALDDYLRDPAIYKENLPYYREEIAKCTHRQFTTGFFFGRPTHESQIYGESTYAKGAVYLGAVEEADGDGHIVFEQKNKFSVGDTIEIMTPGGGDRRVKVLEMADADGKQVESCPHPGERIRMKVDGAAAEGEIMRMPADDGEALSAEGIRSFLNGRCRDFEIVVRQSLGSTNQEVKKRALEGAEEGLVVLAEEQTAGRGRKGRSFVSPRGGGIYMSLLLRPKEELASDIVLITTAASVAVCRAVKQVLGEEPSIKWVNDIFLRGRKVCGILAEAVSGTESGRIGTVAVGIGINCREPEGGFPEELRGIAGAVCTGEKTAPRNALAAAVINELFDLYDRLPSASYMEEYRRLSLVLGRNVTVLSGDGAACGTAVDVDDRGGLVVRMEDGSEQTLRSGEITLRIREGKAGDEDGGSL